jgi:Zn finger protein HypA/HybF involved in hydrogenase expression
MEIILAAATVALVIVFVNYLRREQRKISCPQCNGGEVRVVDKQLKALKQDQTVGYGVKLDVQLIMETHYHCQTCNHSWTETGPER